MLWFSPVIADASMQTGSFEFGFSVAWCRKPSGRQCGRCLSGNLKHPMLDCCAAPLSNGSNSRYENPTFSQTLASTQQHKASVSSFQANQHLRLYRVQRHHDSEEIASFVSSAILGEVHSHSTRTRCVFHCLL